MRAHARHRPLSSQWINFYGVIFQMNAMYITLLCYCCHAVKFKGVLPFLCVATLIFKTTFKKGFVPVSNMFSWEERFRNMYK